MRPWRGFTLNNKKDTPESFVDDIVDDVADKDDDKGDVHDEAGGFDAALSLVDERGTIVEIPHCLVGGSAV